MAGRMQPCLLFIFAIFGFTPLAQETDSFIGTGFGILVLYSVVAVIINVVFNRRR